MCLCFTEYTMQSIHAQKHKQQCAICHLGLQTSTAGSEPSPWACRASSLFILGFSVRVCHTKTCKATRHNTECHSETQCEAVNMHEYRHLAVAHLPTLYCTFPPRVHYTNLFYLTCWKIISLCKIYKHTRTLRQLSALGSSSSMVTSPWRKLLSKKPIGASPSKQASGLARTSRRETAKPAMSIGKGRLGRQPVWKRTTLKLIKIHKSNNPLCQYFSGNSL